MGENEPDPNIVLIVMDTARYDFVGKTERNVTPNLADIASRGTSFQNAFAAAPWTLPSHASIFTGVHPSEHGAHAGNKYLDPSVPTFPAILHQCGYTTMGASNNAWINDQFGIIREFDKFFKGWKLIQRGEDFGKAGLTNEGRDRLRKAVKTTLSGNPVINFLNGLYHQNRSRFRSDNGAARANKWIRKQLQSYSRDDPVFLFVNYLEPHLEYDPPERFVTEFLPSGVSYEKAVNVPQNPWEYINGSLSLSEDELDCLKALYAGEIRYLDHRIGELRRTITETLTERDTIFIITSDHGENIGDHGLMDHQYCLYDTLVHTPLIVEGGGFSTGTNPDELVQHTDIFPTILDLIGEEDASVKENLRGNSFHPNAEESGHDFVVSEYMAPQPSMEALTERLSEVNDRMRTFDRSLRAIRTKTHKLIRASDSNNEFYDIRNDPWESENRFAKDRETVIELNRELNQWERSRAMAPEVRDQNADVDRQTEEILEELGYL
ncbi:sulfatase [Halostella sp. PRR32]|uniref:sulfatase n=1 Tax=Halostella sp. PRR32 TaxID=3098147 RepID=UPI002B1E19FE|nr:sulfatase [Halostella sp. PRR32]